METIKRTEYIIRHLETEKDDEGNEVRGWVPHSVYMEELTQGEMEEITAILTSAAKVEKSGTMDGIAEFSMRMNRESVNPKICGVLLRDKTGLKYPADYYRECKPDDIRDITDAFIDGEGSSLISGVSAMLLSPMLRRVQQENGIS